MPNHDAAKELPAGYNALPNASSRSRHDRQPDRGSAETVNPLGAIIIGLLAGWIAGKLMRGRGYGIIADIILGLIGAIIGNWLFAQLGS